MAKFDDEQLEEFVGEFLELSNLTSTEIGEVRRIAKAFTCGTSATECGVSHETIRARRKRIYRKLDVDGRTELISKMLELALTKLSNGAPRAA